MKRVRDLLTGVDIPVLLNSTPEETLAHRKLRARDGAPSPLPDDMVQVAIPDSDHHIMVDQPLALVAALRALLAAWPA